MVPPLTERDDVIAPFLGGPRA